MEAENSSYFYLDWTQALQDEQQVAFVTFSNPATQGELEMLTRLVVQDSTAQRAEGLGSLAAAVEWHAPTWPDPLTMRLSASFEQHALAANFDVAVGPAFDF